MILKNPKVAQNPSLKINVLNRALPSLLYKINCYLRLSLSRPNLDRFVNIQFYLDLCGVLAESEDLTNFSE